jgi:hypothetical protein
LKKPSLIPGEVQLARADQFELMRTPRRKHHAPGSMRAWPKQHVPHFMDDCGRQNL